MRFTTTEIRRLIQAQEYALRAVQEYGKYPDYQFKQMREAEEYALLCKLRDWRDAREGKARRKARNEEVEA